MDGFLTWGRSVLQPTASVTVLVLVANCSNDTASPTAVTEAPPVTSAADVVAAGKPGQVNHCPPTVPFMGAAGPEMLDTSVLLDATCATKLFPNRHVLNIQGALPAEIMPDSAHAWDFGDTALECRVWARPPISNPEYLGTDNYRMRVTNQGVLKGRCVLSDP